MDFKKLIAEAVAKKADMPLDEIELMLEVPPNSDMGDFALPCFKLAGKLRKSPVQIAQQLAEDIDAPGFVSDIKAVSGYLNFYIDKGTYAKAVLEDVFSSENYGSGIEGKGRTICIDYSSINIAKPFHIGHLSTTVIGAALYRIYSYLGYNCVGINHLGDWGTQFGKLIVAFKLWSSREELEKDSIGALLRLYVRFHEEAESKPQLNDDARAWFKKIESGDAEALELLELFKELTLKEVKKVYDMLGIKFDSYAGESFYNDKMDRVISELKEKNLLKFSEGAYVVDLEEYSMAPCLLLKQDGATLYATRDIAAALYRKDTYDFYKCLYVVAYQQNLHFKQWFKVVELMGYEWAKDLEHVAFGMVSMEDGTLSTRKGKIVFLEEVLERAVAKTLDIINEKSPHLEDKETVARQVGVGAVVFNTLLNNRIKDISFSYDRILNFEGETGPYVQYTYARCGSVIKKASGIPEGDVDYSLYTEDGVMDCVRLLGDFPRVVREACRKNEPSLITRYVVDIAQAYNKFYYDYRIIVDGEPELTKARLVLSEAVRRVIKSGLYLIGVEAPDKM